MLKMDQIVLKIQKFVTDESSQKYDVTNFGYRCIKFTGKDAEHVEKKKFPSYGV